MYLFLYFAWNKRIYEGEGVCQVYIYIEKEISNTLFKKWSNPEKMSQININGVSYQRFLGIV